MESTKRISQRLSLIIAFLIFSGIGDLIAQKTAFTSQDALNVKSFRISGITDDGKYIAGSFGTRKDRMSTDHKRFGDPNYISSGKSELLIMDTESVETYHVIKEKGIIRSQKWSPDNNSLAFFKYDDDRYNLYVYDNIKRKLKKLKIKTDKKISSNSILEWSPDGNSILLSLREKGWAEKADSMFTEATVGPRIVYDSKRPFLKWDELGNFSSLSIIASLDLKSLEVTELLPECRYSSIRMSKQKNKLSFVQTYPKKTVYDRKGGTDYELKLLDLNDISKIDTLIKRSDKRILANWNEDNTMYAYADSGRIFIRSIFEKEAKQISTDTVEIIKEDTSKVKFSINRWSPDGTKILSSSKKGYWLVDIDNGSMEMVYEFPEDKEKAPSMNISSWSPDGKYWYMTYSAKDKWERGIFRYDIKNADMKELIKSEDQYSSWRMTKDGEKFFYTYSDGNIPSDLYSTNKEFNKRKQLTDCNPWIANKKMTKSELVKYRDTDGKELYGVLYYPVDYEAGKKYPLVCEIYEKFFNNGYSMSMNMIANAGYFGFKPSVNLIQGYPGEAWVKGVTSGINMLIDRELIDPDQLGVHGTSYGGYATSLLISQTDRFAAAINISGKVNIISFLGDSPRIGTRNYSAAEVGQDRIGETLWEAPLKYLATSAVLFADRINTPHLLLTGDGDWNVPAVNERELYYALRRLGKEVMWVNYYNGGHGAGAASNEADYHDHWKRILEWYKTHFEKAKEKKDKD
ncbi:prolyl oligopeptidase family serine peptidase [Bacteroidota bacterium]